MNEVLARPIDAQVYEYDLACLPIDKIDVAQPGLFKLGFAPCYLDRLRRQAPVHYCPDGLFGAYWSITRYADIEAVELDPETFSSDHYNGGISITSRPDDPQFFPSFLSMDPPRHTEQRRVIAPAFSPERLDVMGRQFRSWVRDVLDDLPIGEPFDWVDRVSLELPGRMLALLLGFPQERARDLIRWSDATLALPGSPRFPTLADKMRVLDEYFAVFSAIWDERVKRPAGDDLISMLASRPETRDMPRPEILGNTMMLMVAGNETTRTSISASVIAFDQFPDELEKLRRKPELIAGLTPELARWQSPVAHMRRTAMRDVMMRGNKISKGDKVIIWYLSGNRDESVFEDADTFLIDRHNARRHLSFGVGIHRCIGARLADLEIRIVWEEILKRFPRIEVVQPPVKTFSTFTHGYTELQVRIPERRAC